MELPKIHLSFDVVVTIYFVILLAFMTLGPKSFVIHSINDYEMIEMGIKILFFALFEFGVNIRIL